MIERIGEKEITKSYFSSRYYKLFREHKFVTENLAPQVFKDRGSAGFEIAFTALLCTYVIQLPAIEPATDGLFVGGVLLLLTVALLRMMASESEYRSSNIVINPTQIVLEMISFVAILYGLRIAIDEARIPVIIIYLVVILFPVFLIVMQEWLFGDLLIYYAAVAHDFHSAIAEWEVDSEPWISLKLETIRFLERMMEQMLVFSRAEIPLRLSRLVPYNSEISEYSRGGEMQQFAVTAGLLGGISTFTFVVVYLIAGATTIQILTAIWAVLYLRILVRFWYRTYGLSENISDSMIMVVFQVTFYTLFVVVLFGWG